MLYEHGIVTASPKEAFKKGEELQHELFQTFENAATYQVNIGTIETLSGLTMPAANEIYADDRPIELVLEEVDIKTSVKESANVYEQIGFRIGGIRL